MEYFNLHTHESTNEELVLDLVNQYPQEFTESILYYSIGIHPLFISEDRIESDLKKIDSKLANQNCLALGECGLDKRAEFSLELQQKVFQEQLILAEKHQKPVVIHCVGAFQELIAIKKKMKITVPMVIHGFAKNKQTAQQLLENGFYISFGKFLLKNPEMEAVFTSIPNHRFFLETDTAEESLQEVYALAAKYKNINIEVLKQIVNQNVKTVFGFSE